MQQSIFKHPLLKELKYDIPASLAVFVVAIPLCLGIAHASGAPLITGLIAGILGGLVVAPISTSNLSVSGPAAGLTAIVIAGIADAGSYNQFLVAVVLSGLIQLALGYFKLGGLANYFPSNIIKGMLAAIGLILIVKQFPHLIGYDIEEMGVTEFELKKGDINEQYHEPLNQSENSITLLFHSLRHINNYVLAIGLGSLSLLFLWEEKVAKKLRFIPGSLVVVVLGVIAGFAINWLHTGIPLESDHFVLVPSIGSISNIGSLLILPEYSAFGNFITYKLALTLAIVASVESLLSLEAIQKLDPRKQVVDLNRELYAQGIGNTFSGLIGGLPLTAVIVRGSVNIAAGARTKMSAILHGLFIFLSVIYFADVLNYIPLASLAAVLCYTGYKLISPKTVVGLYKQGWERLLPFVVTVVAVFLTDLLIGVGIGLAIAFLFILKENGSVNVVSLKNFGPRKRIVFNDNVYFIHKQKVAKIIKSIGENEIVEIDGSRAKFIDNDIIEMIKEYKQSLSLKNSKLIVGGIKDMVDKESMKQNLDASYKKLFDNNRKWVEDSLKKNSDYFKKLTLGQSPEYLFIGCSDSRVPANEITGTDPAEMFVHRNIANVVVNTDMNAMSVLQYAVEVLNVKHVIVCGHYGCGGVKAAMEHNYHGLIDKWLRNIKDAYRLHEHEFEGITDENERHKKLVEVNVKEQVFNVLKTSFVQRNKKLYGFPQVHGWVYDIADGYIKDLNLDKEENYESYGIYKIED